MSKEEDITREKIVLSALALFSERGINKTSVHEIAYHAGVTRVTVYRHFSDKKELVREVFLRVEQVFQKGLADLKQNPQADLESICNQIGEGLNALPPGDVFARFDELKRLYPDIYSSIQEVRVATLNDIFEHLFAMAERRGLLRSGLNRSFVQTIFCELIINIFENPGFESSELSDAELYHTLADLILHGILRSQPNEE
jgi:AcrR family transcriptional regulator